MIIKTNAIALRSSPYSESSSVVSWLTESHGRVATIIKGAHRRKSIFIGQFDLFYTCELIFYLRDPQALHPVKECVPLKLRAPLRELWKSAACASYLSDLVSQVSPRHAQHEGLYQWLDEGLDMLCRHEPEEEAVLWLELALLKLMGFAPRLNNCLKCKQALSDAARRSGRLLFSASEGGVFCSPSCAAGARNVVEADPSVVSLMCHLQSLPSWHAAQSSKLDQRLLLTAERLIGLLIECHPGVSTESRRIAFDLMRRDLRAE